MSRRPRVLLVEDNAADVHLLKEAFSEVSFPLNLEIAMSGAAALAYLRGGVASNMASRPDLILLDLNLPGLHGLELLETIRRDPSLQSISVIVLSSSANEHDMENARALDVTDYMIKPGDFDHLVTIAGRIAHYCQSVVS